MNGSITGIQRMKKLFLFDVDGTLTPSRGRINEDFRLYMINFCEKHDCYIVTGSDQEKSIEQLGGYLYDRFKKQFQCNGNQVFENSVTQIYESEWKLPTECKEWMEEKVSKSISPFKTGRHIEERVGMANFSILGRNAGTFSRREYVTWDKETNERMLLAKEFNENFKGLGVQAQVSGETGLDVTPIGKDKSQVLEWFDDEVYFFGDACYEGGNDYPLASAIIEKGQGSVYNVDTWKETCEKLKEIDFALSSIC